MDERVTLREFSSRGEAEIVRELLIANGIDANLVSDDCGAVDPALQFGRGVQLLVASDDLEKAQEIVADTLSESSQGEVSK